MAANVPEARAFSATQEERHCHLTGPEVRLTFDDGGRPALTEAILDTLAAEGVRAGFFPTGDWARRYPGIIDRIRADGHWLGNHTGSHTRLAGASDSAIRNAIASGIPSPLLRPPEGSFDDRVRRVAASMGHGLCLWTVDPQDWRGMAGHEVAQTVCNEMQAGGVAVLHLQAEGTVLALREMIACLGARSLELDPLRRHAAATVEPATGAAYWVQPSGEVRTIGESTSATHPRSRPGRGLWISS